MSRTLYDRLRGPWIADGCRVINAEGRNICTTECAAYAALLTRLPELATAAEMMSDVIVEAINAGKFTREALMNVSSGYLAGQVMILGEAVSEVDGVRYPGFLSISTRGGVA